MTATIDIDIAQEDDAGIQADIQAESAADGLVAYLREIAQWSLLTRQEEIELARSIAAGRTAEEALQASKHTPAEKARLSAIILAGEDARERLINCNLRLVVSIAKRYQTMGLSLQDLIQEGNLGLMAATHRFDPDRGVKFATYATAWIRQAITRALSVHGRTVRIPEFMRGRIRIVRRAIDDLWTIIQHEPTPADIAAHTGLTVDQVRDAMQQMTTVASLDASVGEAGITRLVDLIEDPGTGWTPEQVLHDQILDDLEAALALLPQQERQVLSTRYGLDDGSDERTLTAAARALDTTRERVRTAEKRAVALLRSCPALRAGA